MIAPATMLRLVAVLALALPPLAAAEARPRVVATATVVFDILRHVGGDRIDARCLLRPGVDPHAYQPVPEDARSLAGADLVIVNGLGLDGWAQPLITEAGYGGRVVVASTGIATNDPHAFSDLANGVRYAETIRDALIALDAAGADDYRAWAEAYIGELRLLDGWVRRQVATIPPERRRLVTDHDALPSFAKAYGFTVFAPNSAMDDAQPDAQRVAAIAAAMKEQGVKAVFLEQDRNPKLVEQIAREAGARVGGELFLDGPTVPGTPADSYERMFLVNVRTIVRALR